MATMERDVADLAKYATVTQTAAACSVNERRVRNWQNLGLLVPATRVGLIQFRLVDVLRCAVLLELQRYLGQDSPLATELALALTPQQLESLLRSDDPAILVRVERLRADVRVGLDPEYLEEVYERLAAIPR